MDIIKFTNPTAPTKMEQGEIINGITTKMWVERYSKEGEFKFTAPVGSNIRKKLPIGSFVSHLDTTQIMVVENHEISDDRGQNSQVVITGRTFDTFLDNRVIGANNDFPVSGELADYPLAADYSWNQIVLMLDTHMDASLLRDDNDAVPYLTVISTVPGTSLSIPRTIPRGSLYEAMLNLLGFDNLGVKIVRPGPWSPLTAGSPNTALVIYKGVDKSSQVIFSYDTGEIETADYLWSNKRFKNAALITGKWVETVVIPAAVEYGRRWMFVSAQDLDQDFTSPPAGADLTAVVAAMQQRGTLALLAQIDVALTKAQLSKNATKSQYRRDYNLGDTVTVHGDYNESTKMVVSEYVEIEDESGESSYPTFTSN